MQAQELPKQQLLRAAFENMQPDARTLLGFEMALSGVAGEL